MRPIRAYLFDKKISMDAKGILSEILLMPRSEGFLLESLYPLSVDSEEVIQAAVRELEETGYIARSQQHGRNGKTLYFVQEKSYQLLLGKL